MKGQLDSMSARGDGLTGNEVAIAEGYVRAAEETLAVCKDAVVKVNEMFDESLRRREAEIEAHAQAQAEAQALALSEAQAAANALPTEPSQVDGQPSANVAHELVPVAEERVISDAEASIHTTCIDVYVNSKGYLANYQNMSLAFENGDPNGTSNCKKQLNILFKKISASGGALLIEIVRDFATTLTGKGAQELAFCKNFVAELIVVS